MNNENSIKEIVKEKYGSIAVEKDRNSCCGSGCCNTSNYNIMNEEYDGLNGYNPDADLGLGCGLPTKFAKIKKGDTVIDLGSGAGNDCFIARAEAGETGKVIGIDFTPEMIEKAKENVKRKGFTNVEFIFGDIDNMPVSSDIADVVVSNCVLNLVPNKKAVFNEIYRVLKTNGHFSISDIVKTGDFPEEILNTVEMYAGCVAGAVSKDEYLSFIKEAGFKNITVQKENIIILPDEILENNFSDDTINLYKANSDVIRSITVYAEK